RQPRQDLRGPRRRHRDRRRQRRQGHLRAPGRGRGHLAHVPDQGRAHPRLGAPGRPAGPADRQPGHLLARQPPGARRQPDRKGADVSGGPRHRGPGPDHRAAHGGRAAHHGARHRGAGHHLRHRQRAPGLPDRPFPHPGAGHLRQDALHRAPAGRRRPVRDGRGGQRAEARAAVRRRRAPSVGLAGRVPSHRRQPGASGRDVQQRAGQEAGHGAERRGRAAPAEPQVPLAEGERAGQPGLH
ncbi:unnamed protein product, partial [Heterosigma akashiwo]